ncbi:MAG: tRNA preQ1(34) S-adenosylmethionine ribosyltransferase-isomerase QueA [Bdellovibrionota bacterium]|jgi:S-adenosylmethionine:tRNA ribosyltransferase-isomerase
MLNEVFSYNLPQDVIAQRPLHPYHAAKMMVINRQQKTITDETFFDITKYLKAGDLLILNNSRVIPARLLGRVESGGGVELLCIKKVTPLSFRCLAKPMRKLQLGREVFFNKGLKATVQARLSECEVLVEFSSDTDTAELIKEVGIMPIPPYIRSGKSDAEDFIDYQTFFAQEEGSVAAPTAGLHFTPELINKIKGIGCTVSFITLHVGTASFLPIETEDGKDLRRPGVESYLFSKNILEKINTTRTQGGCVVAVGTTTVRALESMVQEVQDGVDVDTEDGNLHTTEIFITPGYSYKAIDALVTNFHQPRTTHLLLVEAFMGKALLSESYTYALTHEYRFLSYGDGMLIL